MTQFECCSKGCNDHEDNMKKFEEDKKRKCFFRTIITFIALVIMVSFLF